MFCVRCGAVITEQGSFCPECGVPLVQQEIPAQQESPVQQEIPVRQEIPAQQEIPRQQTQQHYAEAPTDPTPKKQPKREKKPVKKGLLIAIIVGVVLLAGGITAGVLYLNWYNSDEQVAIRAVEQEDFEKAIEALDGDYDTEGGKALLEKLRGKITDVKERFLSEECSYELAQKELGDLRAYGVEQLNPELDEAARLIETVNTSRTHHSTARRYLDSGNYVDAIAEFRLVSEEDPNYETAKKELDGAVNSFRDDVLAQAAERAASEDYLGAVAILEDALRTLPNDQKLTEQREIYTSDNASKLRSQALEEAEQLANKKDYLGAMKTVKTLMNGDTSDTELNRLYEKYCDAYISQVIEKAEEQAADGNFTAALATIGDGLKNLPGEQKLLDKKTELEKRKPQPLNELLIINQSDWPRWNEGAPVDPFGNDYSGAFNYLIFSEYKYYYDEIQHYVEYRTYQNYSTLRGRIGPYTEMAEDGVCYLQVYVDDQLKYTSPMVYRKTDTFDFAVDISGAEYIKLVYVIPKTERSIIVAAILSNLELAP